jgi:transcriptional regulator with XRE-family HTH domain
MSQHQNDVLVKNFSAFLRRARGYRSQAEMARLLGLKNQQTYQRYEEGRVPKGQVLHQLANKLGVTVDQMLQNPPDAQTVLAVQETLAPGSVPATVRETLSLGPEGAAKKMTEEMLADNLVDWSKMVKATHAPQMKLAILANVQIFAAELQGRIENKLPRA